MSVGGWCPPADGTPPPSELLINDCTLGFFFPLSIPVCLPAFPFCWGFWVEFKSPDQFLIWNAFLWVGRGFSRASSGAGSDNKPAHGFFFFFSAGSCLRAGLVEEGDLGTPPLPSPPPHPAQAGVRGHGSEKRRERIHPLHSALPLLSPAASWVCCDGLEPWLPLVTVGRGGGS